MPTIREIAETCGVTKQTVTARLRELGLWDGHVQKDGRTFLVDAEGASAVAASIKRKKASATASEYDSHDIEEPSALSALKEANDALKTALSASQDQINVLSRELDAKNAQIADLNARLAAAQDAQDRAQETINRLASRSWFDRLFGRGLPAPK